ncbi:hypothetical protein [Glutamicibacter soli]|uniref:hypothetical protein n=1 Tax=Glutamicibacter soli TaxID=453836 RepID=UPI003FD294D8
MPETLWNKIRVPAQPDMWDLVPDLKKLAESVNVPVVVASASERDALTGPAGGQVPEGASVIRTDLGGVRETRIGGVWVRQNPFRHLRLNSDQNVANANYTTISLIASGSGDDSASGISVSGGIATVSRSGIYDIEGQVTFNANATGVRYAAFLIGSDRYRSLGVAAGSASMSVNNHVRLHIPAGTTIAFQAYQTSGVTLTLPAGIDTTRWSIMKVG